MWCRSLVEMSTKLRHLKCRSLVEIWCRSLVYILSYLLQFIDIPNEFRPNFDIGGVEVWSKFGRSFDTGGVEVWSKFRPNFDPPVSKLGPNDDDRNNQNIAYFLKKHIIKLLNKIDVVIYFIYTISYFSKSKYAMCSTTLQTNNLFILYNISYFKTCFI